MANYGINGFGRIGRNVLRAMEQSDVKGIVASLLPPSCGALELARK